MSTPFVRRNLTAAKVRTAVAGGGVGVCTLLVLVQLGFYSTALEGATAIYRPMDYDAVLISPSYVLTTESGAFSRRRVEQAAASPDVAEALPVYLGPASWRSSVSGNRETMIVVGIEPGHRVFRDEELEASRALLSEVDTVLTARGSQPVVQSIAVGHQAEVQGHRVRVVGQYDAGPGFLGAGTLVTSAETFHRIFKKRSRADVSVGLLRAREGSSPEKLVANVKALLPGDVRVLTAAQLAETEQTFWREHASIQFLFLTGAAVAMLTALVILYQILAADVMARLPEYATLKAMGYDDRRLVNILTRQALALGLLGFGLGFPPALAMYAATRAIAHMPMYMSPERAIGVFAGVIAISYFSALLSAKKLRAADPAELF